MRGGRLASRPHIPNVAEAPHRKGFATDAEIDAIVAALLEELSPRFGSSPRPAGASREAMILTWKSVDFTAGEVRLGTDETKNGRGCVFPMNALPELAALIKRQRAYTDRVARERSMMIPTVFHRNGRPILAFAIFSDADLAAGVAKLARQV